MPRTRPKQQTIEATLGQPSAARGAPLAKKKQPRQASLKQTQLKPLGTYDERPVTDTPNPRIRFMPKSNDQVETPDDDSSDSAAEQDYVDNDDDDPIQLPNRQSQRKKVDGATPPATSFPASRAKVVVLDDSDDELIMSSTPFITRQRKAPAIVIDDDDDNDSEDEDVVSPAKRRRLTRKAPARHASSPETSDHEARRPAVKDSPVTTTPARLARPARSGGPRSHRKKQIELLRRRRMGEVVDENELSSSGDGEQKALYDTDSDLQVLSEFEDEEDDEDEDDIEQSSTLNRQTSKATPTQQSQSAKKQKEQKKVLNRASSDLVGDEEDDMEDFIDDEYDDRIGVPDELLHEIPLEFTAHAHKHLKDHFRDVIEWLVQRRINPAFNKDDGLYRLAWRKLDDEVRGLANSKFVSAAWKPDFMKALRSRPYIDQFELPRGDDDRMQTCAACGRSNHPASWRIQLAGKAYNKTTLEDIEQDSEDEDGAESVDEDGMPIPARDREWLVGAVCNSNAETSHNLIHWKYALKDFVEEKLQRDGWMKATRLQERERLSTKARGKLANEIVDKWQDTNIIKGLYADFKANLELARNKPTTGRVKKR